MAKHRELSVFGSLGVEHTELLVVVLDHAPVLVCEVDRLILAFVKLGGLCPSCADHVSLRLISVAVASQDCVLGEILLHGCGVALDRRLLVPCA